MLLGRRCGNVAVVVLVALAAHSGCTSPSRPDAGLRSVSELVTIGFQRSRIVMLNDVHDGASRLVRARATIRKALPVARKSGAVYLAAEALQPTDAKQANASGKVPRDPAGAYVRQPEMRELFQRALDLGFTLVTYEADIERDLPARLRKLPQTDIAVTNWREQEQADNLQAFLRTVDDDERVFVVPGMGHLYEEPQDDWVPMATRFKKATKIDPFTIDQSITAKVGRPQPWQDVSAVRTALRERGGTAGFLRTEDPNDDRRKRTGVDAFVVSLDNTLE